MPDEEKLVRLLSLQERREAIEEQLDWIDQQKAIIQHIYNRWMAEYNRLHDQAMKEMQAIIREETKGRSE